MRRHMTDQEIKDEVKYVAEHLEELKAKQQAESFRATELKQILDILGDTEAGIKTGKMNQEVAIKTGLISILNTRG